MKRTNRRSWMKAVGAVSLGSLGSVNPWTNAIAQGRESSGTSLALQLYESLTEQQRSLVCLPKDHPRRAYVSNWWYIHRSHRIPTTFNQDQQNLIKQIFDSMHSPEHQDAVNQQVLIDQYGDEKNAPAAGFFGTPADDDFEFIFTGHHVTRRCNAHSDSGRGFGGNPVFYGHYPHSETNMRENFREAKDHPGNPYWYQGRLFNQFVQALDGQQQASGLVHAEPRSESPERVIQVPQTPLGLACNTLSDDQKQLLLETMRGMLAMFRRDDVDATVKAIEDHQVLDRLNVSWYAQQYDIGADQFWDTWQIEGPDLVWYFRGFPHIHCYFHLRHA